MQAPLASFFLFGIVVYGEIQQLFEKVELGVSIDEA